MKRVGLLIVGSGPAGYSAAVYAARAGLKPVMVSGIEQGGQLMTTTDVDNWPGDWDGVQGPELMQRMQKHALRFNTKIINDYITEVDFTKHPFYLKGGNEEFLAESVIIATGASAKYLGTEAEKKFKGRGVSACATCDGYFYKGQEVVVVGGGNTAVEEAIFLSNIADHVTVVHRGTEFTAEKILVDELEARAKPGKVKILFESEIHDILGDKIGVTGVQIRDKDGKITALRVHGIFIAIGHKPNTDIFKGQLDMSHGYINVAGGTSMVTQTSVKGIFAAGDVADHHYRQAVTSAGAGCMAALDVRDFLNR